MLRKKTVSLEERLSGRTELERQKDEESVRCRKLMKLAENYKRELNEVHAELRDMRARVLTVSDLQVTCLRFIGRLAWRRATSWNFVIVYPVRRSALDRDECDV
jgi:hypothetical protein